MKRLSSRADANRKKYSLPMRWCTRAKTNGGAVSELARRISKSHIPSYDLRRDAVGPRGRGSSAGNAQNVNQTSLINRIRQSTKKRTGSSVTTQSDTAIGSTMGIAAANTANSIVKTLLVPKQSDNIRSTGVLRCNFCHYYPFPRHTLPPMSSPSFSRKRTSDMSLELTTARTHVSSSLQSSGRAAVQLRPLSARITVEQVPLLSTKGVTNDDVHIEMTDDQC
ncbi:hypothetical protein Tcan_04107 [Toxocara canis]|uniref:Uncharacterized protein n=1 Tax=Toxocara canis TaxID=6265 RepID=A0A0B2VRR3_TOXCA|nr:hypothetical protein Tcan_04107 [Toxocara canis]